MSKVFRFHDGANNISGWGISTQYNNAVHSQGIKDPAGATATREITSIPSPFARMDLMKAAFARVVNEGLSGNTIHHKMVSHCLDVAQMFFKFEVYKQQNLLELIKWDVQNVQSMMNNQDPKQRLFGKTLDLFLAQDAATYNFGGLKSIFLLRYKGPGSSKQLDIIGATSPATLFFTSANKADYVSQHIKLGTHGALSSSQFVPLYLRDPEFINYMYSLRASIANFANLFTEVDSYLNACYQMLPFNIQQDVNAIPAGTQITANYDSLEYAPGVPVEVVGNYLGKKKKINIGAISDFAIKTNRQLTEYPLVLPCGAFTQQWQYVASPWDPNTRAPISDPKPLDSRVLPDDSSQYPYLTMNDFLEPNIVMMDSSAVPGDFFDGSIQDSTNQKHSFLLPIRKDYFRYFTIRDLQQNLTMKCDSVGSDLCVKATLRVPTKKGDIVYERKYFQQVQDGQMLNPKDGGIVCKTFTLTFFPRTRFDNNTTPDYRVSFMSQDDQCKAKISCVDAEGNVITPFFADDRNKDANDARVDAFSPVQPMYAIDQNFDLIALDVDGAAGIAVPIWKGTMGGQKYKFAIDFGTTNTHIEYSINGGISKPLDITEQSRQLAMLNDDVVRDPAFSAVIENNQIPMILGTDIHFPMRTALSYKTATDWNRPFQPYITGNMPFYYGTTALSICNSLETDLKWSSPEQMVRCYLSSIMLLIRNKVIMEGGNLQQTEIIWFYPTSMSTGKLAIIETVWKELFEKYIGADESQLKSIPESMAPYDFYKNRFGAGVNVLTIDIGGGTSDAFIIDNNGAPALITSFRFAANSFFGDAFKKQGADTNGFVKKYQSKFADILQANGLNTLNQILNDILDTKVSADYVSMLFSIKDNKDVKNVNCSQNVDFMKMLSDSAGAKTLMLIFYSSIIYHMATIIKEKKEEEGSNIKEPQYIAFSGNGSKLLSILGANTSTGLETLSEYTMMLFEKVLGTKYPSYKLSVITDAKMPKEATCKGGLTMSTFPSAREVKKMSCTVLGTKEVEFVGTKQYSELSNKDWRGVDDAIKDFTEKFYEVAKEFNVKDEFGTIPYPDLCKYKGDFSNSTENRVRNALIFYNMLNEQAPIENTLFFYPITLLINELAPKIL